MTIDLGDREGIAEVGVDTIGKINRCGSSRKGDDIASGREDEDLIFKNIHLHIAHEFGSFLVFSDNSLDRLYPIAILGSLGLARLRVGKVRRHTHLCLSVHLGGAYLDLRWL